MPPPSRWCFSVGNTGTCAEALPAPRLAPVLHFPIVVAMQ